MIIIRHFARTKVTVAIVASYKRPMPDLEPAQNLRLQAHVVGLLTAWQKKRGTTHGFQADLVRQLASVGYHVKQPTVSGWLKKGKFAHDSARALARLAGYARAESLMGEYSDAQGPSQSETTVRPRAR